MSSGVVGHLPSMKLASMQLGAGQIEYDDGFIHDDASPHPSSISYMEHIGIRNVTLESPTLNPRALKSREPLRETAYLGSEQQSTMHILLPMKQQSGVQINS